VFCVTPSALHRLLSRSLSIFKSFICRQATVNVTSTGLEIICFRLVNSSSGVGAMHNLLSVNRVSWPGLVEEWRLWKSSGMAPAICSECSSSEISDDVLLVERVHRSISTIRHGTVRTEFTNLRACSASKLRSLQTGRRKSATNFLQMMPTCQVSGTSCTMRMS
jgi:hypothetical protein